MSNFDEDDDGDFSASEDEWRPNGNDTYSSDSDFEDENSINITQNNDNLKNKNKRLSHSPTSLKNRKKLKKPNSKTSLRSRMFNKYRPLPKTHVQPKNLNPLFEQSRAAERKTRKRSNSTHSESSGSSVNDHLMNPNDIDIMSSYFDVKEPPTVNKRKVQNDSASSIECNAGGISLHNFDDKPSCSKFSYSTATTDQNENKPTAFFEKIKRKSDAKMSSSGSLKMDINENTGADNILQLLALGEKPSATSKTLKNQPDSDSDLEEVEGNETNNKNTNINHINKKRTNNCRVVDTTLNYKNCTYLGNTK